MRCAAGTGTCCACVECGESYGTWRPACPLYLRLHWLAERPSHCSLSYHHAGSWPLAPPLQGYVMLTHWLPEGEENKLPPNASHQVGVGAFVMNERREVLVVQERSGPLRGKGVWKMPTGLVQVGSGSVGGCICRPFQACCHAAQPCLCRPSTPLHPCTPSLPAPAARGGYQ